MEKEHSAILGQIFVKKQNDRINEVVHTSIPTQDREC
jgi:23S rRNA maturation mini-RNase III